MDSTSGDIMSRAKDTGEGVLGWISALNRWEVVYWTEPPGQLPHWRTAGNRDVLFQPTIFAALPTIPDLSAGAFPCYIGIAAVGA